MLTTRKLAPKFLVLTAQFFCIIYVHVCVWHQIQVQHPAAKSMIEISRTQDEEVGDGTTSVIILGMCVCLLQ